jgi:G3E family GTPase
MKARRTPVWLVTGYLGSGKTTLLSAWLREPGLARAALIVNEIGEVGLDDRLLAQAVDSASLLANSCLCCSGMQGLQEALEALWWDRLHRRRPAFDAVVIETTGLADPAPVLEAFRSVAFLQERYILAGVVTTVAATAGAAVLAAHAEARAQVRHADVLVITKTDQANAAPLLAALQDLHPHGAIADSAHASLHWREVLALLPQASAQGREEQTMDSADADVDGQVHGHAHAHGQGHGHGHANGHVGAHHHDASASFVALPTALDRSALDQQITALHHTPLLRLKGVVHVAGCGLQTLQWSLGDDAPSLTPYQGPTTPLGLTCIQAAG